MYKKIIEKILKWLFKKCLKKIKKIIIHNNHKIFFPIQKKIKKIKDKTLL